MHLLIINFGYYYFNDNSFPINKQLIYINGFWLIIAYFTKIYNFNRYTKVPKIISHLFFQFSVFTLAYLTYYALFDTNLIAKHQMRYLIYIFVIITVFRVIYFYALRKYRLEGFNFRNVVVIGENKDVHALVNFFNKRQDFGFRYKGYFDDSRKSKPNYLGSIEESFTYIKENEIDQIYCSVAALSKSKLNEFMTFADNNVKILKLIPDSKELFTKMKLEYYGYVPVLSVRKLNLDNPLIKIGKRLFDIVFSLLIIVLVLSWLTPILWVLIKKETKGPIIFKQTREGINGKPFTCYKFRSMGVNKNADK
ncbi:MAG: sugar transferase, partial [Flavobacteriaceae bacterium]